MEFEQLKHNWELLGEQDGMWAILSVPSRKGGKWDVDEFFATGVADIVDLLARAHALRIEVPRGAALDFGCGMGRMTQALCPHFQSVVGVDVSESMIRQAINFNRHPDMCRYHLNTKQHLGDFHDHQFGFCVSFIVLQHMLPAYAKEYLKELCRVLMPKGVLLFQIPTLLRLKTTVTLPSTPQTPPPSDQDGLPGSASESAPPTIEMYATPLHEVVRLLDEAGLEIISLRSDGRAGPEFLSHEIWAVKS